MHVDHEATVPTRAVIQGGAEPAGLAPRDGGRPKSAVHPVEGRS
jgi:hypothetical protein